jgi:hypothetical protein
MDGAIWILAELGEAFALCANAQLSDDGAVAKMGASAFVFDLNPGHRPLTKKGDRYIFSWLQTGPNFSPPKFSFRRRGEP